MNRRDLAKEYRSIARRMKLLEARRDELRKEIERIGPFQTAEFEVDISVRHRECLASVQAFCESIGRKRLVSSGLIREIEYTVIDVKERF